MLFNTSSNTVIAFANSSSQRAYIFGDTAHNYWSLEIASKDGFITHVDGGNASSLAWWVDPLEGKSLPPLNWTRDPRAHMAPETRFTAQRRAQRPRVPAPPPPSTAAPRTSPRTLRAGQQHRHL